MKVLLYLALVITATFASHHDGSHDSHEEDDHVHHCTKAEEQIIDSSTEFSLHLYDHISKSLEVAGSKPKNMFFSPLSIFTAFAILSVGAKCETHHQILEGLSLNQRKMKDEDMHEAFGYVLKSLNKPKSHRQVNIGNALVVDDHLKIKKRFGEELEDHYYAEILHSNFKDTKVVEKKVNDYVKNKTHGKIEELVKDLRPDAKLLIINYILFKGEWETPFHPDFTHKEKFFVDKDTSVDVDMMSRIGQYKIFLDNDLPCIVIELPYKDNASMLVIVPELGKIHEVEKALSKETITRWKNSVRERVIDLHVPKFSISSSVKLENILSDMGISKVFTDQADLTGIADVPLKVSQVFHKAVLDVDEKGTEAAGATAIEGVPMALFPTHKVDRPFITLLCTKDIHTMLFLGRIIDPTEK